MENSKKLNTEKLTAEQQDFMMNVELTMRRIDQREISMSEGYHRLQSLFNSHQGINKPDKIAG